MIYLYKTMKGKQLMKTKIEIFVDTEEMYMEISVMQTEKEFKQTENHEITTEYGLTPNTTPERLNNPNLGNVTLRARQLIENLFPQYTIEY